MSSYTGMAGIRADADGNEYIDPMGMIGDMLWSRPVLAGLVGVDVAFGGGEMLGAGAGLAGDIAGGVGDTLGGWL